MKTARRAARAPFRLLFPVVGALAAGTAVTALGVATVLARLVVTPHKNRIADTTVLGIDERRGRITLGRTADTALPGRYGLWFGRPERYLQLGELLEVTESTVVRALPPQNLRGVPNRGRATFSGWVYVEPADLGLPSTHLNLPTEVGGAPAWIMPAPQQRDGRWAVLVHGRGTTRAETLRAVPAMHAQGRSCILVSYRNDGVAPESSDGMFSLGQAEWADVDSALVWARGQGATDISLMGWSMGGEIAVQTLLRSAHADLVSSLILESPVTDWHIVLDYQAGLLHVPGFVRRFALWMLGQKNASLLTGQDEALDLDALNLVARARELSVPTLILHSLDDGFVPPNGSIALAEARPDLVELELFTVARHTKLWNVDAARWTRAIDGFLSRH